MQKESVQNKVVQNEDINEPKYIDAQTEKALIKPIKSKNVQKQKLLFLQKILLEKTDETHGLTADELISELAGYGISSARKSLYNDLRNLEKFGLDICRCKTNTVRYYVGNRDFELAELKVLVDAVQSSKFITHKKSVRLIKKIESLAGVHQGECLHREVCVDNRLKAENEKIYYNVDAIHNAISKDRQIRFRYYKWRVNFNSVPMLEKEEKKQGGYVVSPWKLCWDNENYYLIAYDGKERQIKHFRVDKMDSIEQTTVIRDGKEVFADFDISKYSKSMFLMFGGEEEKVTLSADVELAGVIADRFGTDVLMSKESDGRFRVSVDVALSPQFYGWIFGLGDKIKILSPQRAVEEYEGRLKNIIEMY